jgi:hypothetical protein
VYVMRVGYVIEAFTDGDIIQFCDIEAMCAYVARHIQISRQAGSVFCDTSQLNRFAILTELDAALGVLEVENEMRNLELNTRGNV